MHKKELALKLASDRCSGICCTQQMQCSNEPVPKAPKYGTKKEPYADGVDEPEPVVLRHAPVSGPVLVVHCSELGCKGLGVLAFELEGVGSCCGTAELLQQPVVLPEVAEGHVLACRESTGHVFQTGCALHTVTQPVCCTNCSRLLACHHVRIKSILVALSCSW